MIDPKQTQLVDDFQQLFYKASERGFALDAASYFGFKLWKSPVDLQLLQETIFEIKPKLIIETGTAFGGSALFMAHLLDQFGSGKVVSVDINPIKVDYPRHPKITYIGGKTSVHPNVLKEVSGYFDYYGGPTLVVLDSDHSESHVLAELNAYNRFVSPGGYLVVESTYAGSDNLGASEALRRWLPVRTEYKRDERKHERYLFTFNTWLRKRIV